MALPKHDFQHFQDFLDQLHELDLSGSLIRLRAPIEGDPRSGKAPLNSNWQNESSSESTLRSFMHSGGNVGIALNSKTLVVDVDSAKPEYREYARREGLTPLDAIVDELGLDLTKCLAVRTGSGGLHLYFKLQPNKSSIRSTSIPAIDLKVGTGLVVAPGSVHFSGKHYRLAVRDGIELPECDVEKVQTVRLPLKTRSKKSAKSGVLDAESLEAILEGLEPGDFPTNEEWLPLMMSVHHSTGGDQHCLDLFEAWSSTGPGYADDIASRWNSCSLDKGSSYTVRTLKMIIKESGAAEALAELDRAIRKKPSAKLEASSQTGPPTERHWSDIAKAFSSSAKGRILRDARDWLIYSPDCNRYEPVDDERFESQVYRFLDGLEVLSKGDVVNMVPSSRDANETAKALMPQSQAPANLPCWLEEDGPNPRDLLAVRNGILNLKSGELLPKTERFASRNSAQVDYDPDANCPRWDSFIREIFSQNGDGEEYDAESAATLQEIMGYLLTHDTSLHKIFLMVSRPRGGKGTIIRTLTRLIGEGSLTSPSSKDLKGAHGLASLVGKQVAVMTDMRMTGSQSIIEDMLRISGEDTVTINPKNKPQVDVRLPTRFLLATNQLPNFRDASGAIVTRLINVKTHASFLGKEDHNLEATLADELPGILNWCLEGLQRVRKQGFIQPADASKPDLDAMMRNASPVSGFVEDHIEIVQGHEEVKSEVFEWFTEWCHEAGLNYSGGANFFPTDLRALIPGIDEKRARREDGARPYVYVGIKLVRSKGADRSKLF